MKRITTLIGILFFSWIPFTSFADDNKLELILNSDKNQTAIDERTVLKIPPAIKSHHLLNMRSHLNAIQSIIGLISKKSFDEAARIAESKLGSADEMKTLWSSYKNENFKRLGREFRQSGDDLSKVLGTKDLMKSLNALHATMNYCVRCHSMFRQ